MSVYKRKGAATFSYDFRLRGRRFSGDTGETEKRQARLAEGVERKKAEATAALAGNLDAPKTWAEGASRWFNEIGAHHKNLEQTLSALAWLSREIGPQTPLTEITDNLISRLVAKRRMEKRKVGRDRSAQRLVSPATVNRTMTEPMRKVLTRARKVWRVPIGEIDWSQHMLAEPKERVREASESEEASIMSGLARGYEKAAELAFWDGCRRIEIVGLKKTDVDFFTRQYTVTGKGRRTRVIPMSDDTFDLLWGLKDDPTPFVFTYEAKRTDKRKGIIRGERYPITSAGLRTAMRRAVKKAGVVNFRPHDARHTAATRVLRTSNIRVVQELLGHSEVTTTAKYAHAMKEDVRAALNAARPTKNATTRGPSSAKILKESGE